MWKLLYKQYCAKVSRHLNFFLKIFQSFPLDIGCFFTIFSVQILHLKFFSLFVCLFVKTLNTSLGTHNLFSYL